MLFEFAKRGENAAALVLKTLKMFFEDVILFPEHLSDRRRREILTALRENGNIFSFLQSFIRLYLSSPTQQNLSLAFLALKTLEPLLDAVPCTEIVTLQLPQMLVNLCQVEALKLSASNLLLVLATSRSNSAEEKIASLAVISGEYFERFASAIEQSVSKPGKENHTFATQGAQILTLILSNYISLVEKSKYEVTVQFAGCIGIMLAFFNHPSLVVLSLVAQFWERAFRAKKVVAKHNETLSGAVPQFLSTFSRRIIGNEVSQIERQYATLDFDSEEDYISFRSKINAMLGELLRSCCYAYPNQTVEYSVESLNHAVSKFQENNSQAEQSMTNAVFLVSNSLMVMWPENNRTVGTNQVVMRCISKTLQLLLTSGRNGSFYLNKQLEGLRAVVPFFVLDSTHLKQTLDLAIAGCSFIPPTETIMLLSNETVDVRRKALSLLLKLAVAVPVPLIPFLQSLSKWANEFIKSEMLLEGEKIKLLAALAAVSNSIVNKAEQETFLYDLVAPVVVDWSSAGLSKQISTPLQLVGFLTGLKRVGQSATPPLVETSYRWVQAEDFNATVLVRIRKFYNLLFTLHSVWERCAVRPDGTGWAVSPQIAAILPNIAGYLHALHEMGAPDFVATLPEEWRGILQASAVLLTDRDGRKANTPQEHVEFIVENTRGWCYCMLGWAAQKEAMLQRVPQIDKTLSQSVLLRVECLSNKHLLRLFEKFVVPYTVSCPQDSLGTCFCFLDVMKTIQQRMTTPKVEVVSPIPQRACSTDLENAKRKQFKVEQDEIANEQLLSNLKNSYVEWARTLLGDQTAQERIGFFFGGKSEFSMQVIQTLFCVVGSLRSSFKKAINTCTKLVQCYKQQPAISLELLKPLAQLYSAKPAEDFASELGQLIVELLCVNLAKHAAHAATALAALVPDEVHEQGARVALATACITQLCVEQDPRKRAQTMKAYLQPLADLRTLGTGQQLTTRQFALLAVDEKQEDTPF